MAGARWWSKHKGLPASDFASWSRSLAAQPGRQVRILAWASLAQGVAIASPSVLSYPGDADDADWQHLGWHDIERGGWEAESSRLGWVRYGGERGELGLVEPGQLPEVFRERVAASIVLEKSMPALSNRQVLVVGRRDLADGDQPITWHATLGRGLRWEGAGVREAVDEAIAEVRTEYDMG